MRAVFMGTPEFAVPSLVSLYNMDDVEIAGVFTQPDRPVGRGRRIEESPVKTEAKRLGIPVFQFERVRKQAGLDCMRGLKPDIVVIAAFGQLLSQKLLDVPKLGTVNVHASLLPRHRGAAPINWSIIMGDEYTGITTMLTNAGLDTGDMLLSERVKIGADDTAGALTERLSRVGARLLRDTIRGLIAGELRPVPQDEALMTYEPMLTKETGLIDWRKGAADIVNLVRGVNPWPGAYTSVNGQILKVWAARPCEGGGAPGAVICASAKAGLRAACGGGEAVEIVEMQAPNSKRMSAKAYLTGKSIDIGVRLGE